MSSVDFHYPAERAVRYLNANPLIEALRFQPEDFELKHGWLNHAPSRHRFQFERSGKVTIEANCSCAVMSIRPEQKQELIAMFHTWRSEYWVPLQTNQEFASHFARPNAWVRLVRDIRMAFRRFVRREEPAGLPAADVLAPRRATAAE
ncbi:hypothetical protein DFR50_11110 [Roseiarcus fermentans]|uniref:Uncharacterized protein n=1 Tax=Roseiarcus fermentans TaxID=1473586 RepID=A0A366FGG3_9HYPH|nr:hypothetical protein [Roseiarcus fermentans]RBP13748.1 hypothetical protein DFR50_11110 [Roseiarcus fermentans]